MFLGRKKGAAHVGVLREFYLLKSVNPLTLHGSAARHNVAWIQPRFSRCDEGSYGCFKRCDAGSYG